MKKTLILALVAILALPLFATHQREKWFLGTAVDVNAGATVTYPATLPSGVVDVSKYSEVSITVVFSRAAGAADTVDIEIWCSPEGSTWSLLRETDGEALFQIPTNTDAITGNVVRVTFIINVQGLRYLRLGSVENTDGVNNITGFNVLCSMGSI